jgi:sugar phosphate isomerase/epimerase
MQLGIFAKTFPRPTLEQTLQAAADAGVAAVQFNLSVRSGPGHAAEHAVRHHRGRRPARS